MSGPCSKCVKKVFAPPPAFYRCTDDRAATFDVVFGNQFPPCREVRENEEMCGQSGKWFKLERELSFLDFIGGIFGGRPA